MYAGQVGAEHFEKFTGSTRNEVLCTLDELRSLVSSLPGDGKAPVWNTSAVSECPADTEQGRG